MKEYGHIFENDPVLKSRGVRLASKVRDLTEFLSETGYKPFKPVSRRFSLSKKTDGNGELESLVGKRVSYHDACHLAHTQKITQQPRSLIRKVPGIVYSELPESSWCCGSAGIYNIVHFDDSMKLLDRKVQNIMKVSPDIVVTGNPGCMLQIQHGLRKRGLDVTLMHTATFLWKACELS